MQEKVYRDCLLYTELTQGGMRLTAVNKHRARQCTRQCTSRYRACADRVGTLRVFHQVTIASMHAAAYCNDVLVGAIAIRLQRQPSGRVQLYIITLGVLAPYRNYGVGEQIPLHASPPDLLCRGLEGTHEQEWSRTVLKQCSLPVPRSDNLSSCSLGCKGGSIVMEEHILAAGQQQQQSLLLSLCRLTAAGEDSAEGS